MPDAMTARFDAFARHLVGLVPSWDMSRAEQKNRFIYESVVSGVLTLMREAIDSDRRDDASNFYTQLFHHERHQHDRRMTLEHDALDGYSAELDYVFQTARLTIAGWCVRRFCRARPHACKAASAVFSLCAQCNYGVPGLMRIWEWANRPTSTGDDGGRPTMLDRLGVSRWESDVRDIGRPGFSDVYSPNYSWQLDGVLALMLQQTPVAYEWEAPPSREGSFWSLDQIRNRLNELSGAEWLRVPPESREARVAEVLAVVEASELETAKARFVSLLDAEIDKGTWGRLQEDTASSYSAERLRGTKLTQYGVANVSGATQGPVLVRRRWNVHKEDLAVGFHPAHGTAAILARDIGLHQDIASFGLMEYSLIGEEAPTANASLGVEIQRAIDELRNSGRNPNVLIVPSAYGMHRELRAAKGQYDESDDPGNRYHGPVRSLFELHVVKWPYTNPRSIVVCESQGLFARLVEEPGLCSPKLDLLGSEMDDWAAMRTRAEGATTLGEMPRLNEVYVVVEVSIPPLLGIADLEAARAIALPESVVSEMESRRE